MLLQPDFLFQTKRRAAYKLFGANFNFDVQKIWLSASIQNNRLTKT